MSLTVYFLTVQVNSLSTYIPDLKRPPLLFFLFVFCCETTCDLKSLKNVVS